MQPPQRTEASPGAARSPTIPSRRQSGRRSTTVRNLVEPQTMREFSFLLIETQVLSTSILFVVSAIYVFWDANSNWADYSHMPGFNKAWLKFGVVLSVLAAWGLVAFWRSRSDRQ